MRMKMHLTLVTLTTFWLTLASCESDGDSKLTFESTTPASADLAPHETRYALMS